MGYMRGGTILRVDLSLGEISRESTSLYEDLWIGGRGVNAKIMYAEVAPDVKPLDPENVLVFSVGPLTGTMAPGSGRTEIASKSPTTKIQGMSNIGGFWGPELKYAGYDSLVVTGRATKPVYISINNNDVQIKDASNLWGMDSYQTPKIIREETCNPNTQIVCIGPAGENMVAYATIQTRIGSSSGRTGMGAVMGSKNLKAVAVRGTNGVSIARPEEFFETCTEAFRIQKATPGYEEYSSGAGAHQIGGEMGWATVLGNYEATMWEKQGLFPQGHESFWREHTNTLGDGKIGCFNCQIRCSEYYNIPDLGPIIASCNLYHHPVWTIKNSDLMVWYEIVSKCQRFGIDVVTLSRMLAWAIELYEKGKISEKDTDGIRMKWDSREAIIEMTDKIIKREGFGDILASDVWDATAKIGRGVEEPLHIKGAPIVATNIVNWRPRAIGAAVNPRGGDYFRARYCPFDTLGGEAQTAHGGMASPDSWEAKTAFSLLEKALKKEGHVSSSPSIGQYDYTARGALAALAQKLVTVSDILGQCRWNTIMLNAGIGIELQSKMLSAGEGCDRNVEYLLETASRVAAQERAFVVREGFDRADDMIPKRLFNYSMPGYFPNDILDRKKFEQMKNEYYEMMEWDVQSGIPTRETFERLGLSAVAADLEKSGKLPKTSPEEKSKTSEG